MPIKILAEVCSSVNHCKSQLGKAQAPLSVYKRLPISENKIRKISNAIISFSGSPLDTLLIPSSVGALVAARH
jgi:hypothetical protein